jgi:hypothetical protein
MFIKFKVGDRVMVHCMSGLGTGGFETITGILNKYDEDTGKPYKVLSLNGHLFDAKGGNAITPPYAYYIITRKEV